MNLPARWPRLAPALLYLALPTLFAVVGAAEALINTPQAGWSLVLRREVLYWGACVILFVPSFRLCRWLHAGPHRWSRYLLGLTAGTVCSILAFPLFYQLLRVGLWAVTGRADQSDHWQPNFWADYRALFPHLITAAVIIFACAVAAWHAVRHYQEARERQLEAAELGTLLQQAQLQALRSQLNPHFLFNTLHSIAELIHENPRLAEQILLQLGELLRKALKSQAVEVPLSEELDFIRSYLAIEQMRLGPRLTLAWHIDPAALEVKVPSLILQPLVENAVQHGVGGTGRSGRIEITAACAGDRLELAVRDDGPGLDPTAAGPDAGIGLANTRARLERRYGTRATFRLTSDRGVLVSLSLPRLP